MTYIWNIYEPADPTDISAEDPFDVFIYSQRMPQEPHQGDLVFIEGRNHRIIACVPDHNLTEAQVRSDEVYYKVCVV